MNPETHTCDCGFTWRHGHSGAHSCEPYYRKTIAELRAAAPQVVADERALSLLSCIGRTIIGLRDGWGDKNDADEAIANIAEVKSAIASAPVQAQKPVMVGSVVKSAPPPLADGQAPYVFEYWVAGDRYTTTDYEKAEREGTSFPRVISAPVQPVAVPVGWRDAIAGLMDFAPTNGGPIPGMTRGGNWLRKEDVIEALSNVAAPAAQGDAKDSERMNFLVSSIVEVRKEQRYGSSFMFISQAQYDEEQEFTGTTLRAQIDAAIAAKAAS